MAAADAASNAVRAAKVSDAARKRQEQWESDRQARGARETALEMALKMCPDYGTVRTAEALVSDAEKLTAYMLDGKIPAKRPKGK